MKIEEAIGILKGSYKTVSMCLTSADCKKFNNAIDLAIESLKKEEAGNE